MIPVLGGGCWSVTTRFEITDYRPSGETEFFHDSFDECYYAGGPNGNIDLVARRTVREGGDGSGDLTQIIHARTVFRAVPGKTYAESSMINATVTYAILSHSGGVCYEGAGFLSCKENRRRRVLSGRLEQAQLQENRRVGYMGHIFEHAELAGAFHAERNPRKVVGILNELDRCFGPRPGYQPPPNRRDPM